LEGCEETGSVCSLLTDAAAAAEPFSSTEFFISVEFIPAAYVHLTGNVFQVGHSGEKTNK